MKSRFQRWFDRGGSPVERELAEHRPEPPASLVRAISARIQQRPTRSRARVGFALGLSAAMLAAIGATGGLGYASSSIRDASSSISKLVHATSLGHSSSQRSPVSTARPSSALASHISAACTQYSLLPTITSLVPPAGKAGAQITINGTHFAGDSALDKVTFFNGSTGVIVTAITRDSDSRVEVNIPSGAKTGAVTVHNCVGTSNAKSLTVYQAPTISSFTPSTVVHNQTVTIAGTNFMSGNTTVKFGAVAATPVTVTSATSIKVNVPPTAALGTVTVTVTTLGGAASKSITVAPVPTLTGLSPGTAVRTQSVTLTGANYVSGKMTVLLDQGLGSALPPITPKSTTSTTIVFKVPTAATLGHTYTVKVKDADGTSAASKSLKIAGAPTLTSLSPISGNKGSPLTLNGTNFVTGQMTVTFKTSGGTTAATIVPASVHFVSATALTVTVPTSGLTAGVTYNVTVTDGNGTTVAKTYKVNG